MPDYARQAKDIIGKSVYMTVATASPEGNPWVSPVFFAYDDRYNLYWISNKDARHSQYVRSNPNIAIVIFDSSAIEGSGDGVYFEAEARELSDENDIKPVIPMWNQRAQEAEFQISGFNSVLGDAAWRVYKATPKTISKLKEGEYSNGQYVDKRIEIDLL